VSENEPNDAHVSVRSSVRSNIDQMHQSVNRMPPHPRPRPPLACCGRDASFFSAPRLPGAPPRRCRPRPPAPGEVPRVRREQHARAARPNSRHDSIDHSRPRLPRCSNARSVHAAAVARRSTAFVVKLGWFCKMTMCRSIQTCQPSFSLPPRQRRVRAAPAVGICFCTHLSVLPLFKFKLNRPVLLCCAALLSCVCA